MKLTDSQREVIVAALHVAAEQYRQDANTVARESQVPAAAQEKLVQQFLLQAARAQSLAEYIEEAE